MLAFMACMVIQTAWGTMIGTPNYSDPVTVVFGTGNPDGSFTSATSSEGSAVALRFKKRFDTDMTNDGAGTYWFDLGTNVNIEFSIAGGDFLSHYTAILGVDRDPGLGTNFDPFTFDPLLTLGDNSYANTGAANGSGTEGSYSTYGLTNSIAQNSQPLHLFGGIDYDSPGVYGAYLSIYDKESQILLARSEVQVVIGEVDIPRVPDNGGTFLLSSLGFFGVLGCARLIKLRNT